MNIKAVGIKELRNGLSAYIKEAHSGTQILVLDRQEVVAVISEPSPPYNRTVTSSRADELRQSGVLIGPTKKRKQCTVSPVSLPAATSRSLLDADREDSRDASHDGSRDPLH